MFKKVYIIDDDEVTLYLTSLMISLYAPGSLCTGFQNGPSALLQLKHDLAIGEQPETVIVDLNMPVMSGFELLDELDLLFAEYVDIPQVYVLTSSINRADKIACLQHRLVNEVIEKPLTDEKLQELENQISSKRMFHRTLD